MGHHTIILSLWKIMIWKICLHSLAILDWFVVALLISMFPSKTSKWLPRSQSSLLSLRSDTPAYKKNYVCSCPLLVFLFCFTAPDDGDLIVIVLSSLSAVRVKRQLISLARCPYSRYPAPSGLVMLPRVPERVTMVSAPLQLVSGIHFQ